MFVHENMTVEDFKNAWLSAKCPIRPPFKDPIFFTEMTASLCIYREKNFQIELYIVKENMDCPTHHHPGVDSTFVYLTGDLEFGDENGHYKDLAEFQHEGIDGTHALFGRTVNALNGEKHSVRTHHGGAAYLSFEKWNNGFPNSVAVNWVGETVGEQHTTIVKSNEI